MVSTIRFKVYRLMTILKSFRTLYTLSSEHVDAFLGSYSVFDHDWANEDEMEQSMGSNYYEEVKSKLVDYYRVLNHLCALGQIEKMYIPPALDLSKSISGNQVLFEQKMSRDLGIKKGDVVLDIGCGRGRVASHVASHTGADVVGINIDPDQLESARRFALGNGLARQCQFKMADLNDTPLPFASNSFDAVYQIQTFSYARRLGELSCDLNRILKPGGKLACLDWVCLPGFDASNPYHVNLIKRIKPLIGAIGTSSVEQFVHFLRRARFKICISENPSINGLQAPLIRNADRFFTLVAHLIGGLVRLKVLPVHFELLFDRLTKDGQALVEADRQRLVTTSYYIVAQKEPVNS
jgi:sterol 24-C-methyltransferase